MDNKVVSLLSTNVQPGGTGVVSRMQTNATPLDVAAPHAVISYNKYLGGVDRGDQMRQYYHLRLKSRKFYKYIFWFLVDVTITNAFVIYKQFSSSPRLPYKKFRLELAKSLIGTYNSRKRVVHSAALPPPSPRRVRRETLAHFPQRKPTGSQKGVARCWYCAHTRRPAQRRETSWYCHDCQLYLCHTAKLTVSWLITPLCCSPHLYM